MIIQGIDTIEFGIDIANYNKDFEKILLDLCVSKEKAQQNFGKDNFIIGNINFIIKGKGQGLYAYKLECDDFHICFMSKSIENVSPIYVKFISGFLWKYGYKEAFEIFINWFNNTFKSHIIGNRVSRLDICLDIDEIEFVPNDVNNFFSKARKREVCYPKINECIDSINFNGRNFTGFVIGKGSPLLCRIYDKTLEIINSSKEWFKEIWIENNWNQNNTIWRIEFQIRRKILKELKISNVYDIEDNVEGIWAYLTQKWITLRIIDLNKNVSRYKIDDRWIKVQKVNREYTSSSAIREKIRYGNLDKLLDQCCGIFTTIGALKNEEKTRDVYLVLIEHMQHKNKKKNTTFKEEVEKRKNRFIVKDS